MGTLDERPASHRGSAVPDLRWRRFTVAATVSLLLWSATAVLLVGPWLDSRQKQVLSDTMFVLFPMPGVLYASLAARATTGTLRRTWACLTGTLTCWFIGNVVWFYYQFLADSQPYPSLVDPFYFAALIFAAAALLYFPTGTRPEKNRSRLLLDGSAIACAVFLLGDLLVLNEVIAGMGTGLAAVVFVTYPVADALLASMAIMLLTRIPGRLRTDLVMIALGLLAYAIADATYGLHSARGQFQIGTPLDLGWLAGYLLVGLAALAHTARSTNDEALRRAGTNLTGTVLVYAVAAIAVSVGLRYGVHDLAEILLIIGLLILMGVREVVMARDNQELHGDLEERVRARTAELERLAQHHQSILDAAAEGVYGIDRTGRITFANPAAARALGYQLEELVGQMAHDLFHGEHPIAGPAGEAAPAPEAGCHLTATLEGSSRVVRRTDTTYVRRDGTRFPVELTAAPMREDGRMTGAVVVFADISERHAVDRMKDEFVSVVSHELRTPLTAIRGSLGLIAGGAVGELPAGAARMVSLALDNSDRLTRLINDILDLERIQSGAVPLELSVHDAAEVLEATLASVRSLADAAGVALVVGAAEGRVHGDADRLVQALTNLIGNAIKFSPRGGEIVVAAEREGSHVTFRVQDQGRGIPEEKLEAIFGRFQQVDSSDSRQKGGTGLGLAITKTIVDRHGGRIWVESEVDRGSVFRFTIPAATDPALQATDDEQPEDAPTVLVCDDDPDILEILGRLLTQHGYAARPVARGREAVELAVSGHPDVILLDLRMPGMTGWEAIAELKARPQTENTPIIVMSGLSADADPELAARTEGWLTKPVDEREMAQLLLGALRGDGQPSTVLVVEDDDDLAEVLVAMFERQGLRVVRAASQSDAVIQIRRARPDVLVLDIYLLDGNGYGVVDELRRDGRLGEVPVVVYSGHPLDALSKERLRLGEMVFMTKGQDSPDDLVRRVVSVVHSVARRDRVDLREMDPREDEADERTQRHGIATRLGG